MLATLSEVMRGLVFPKVFDFTLFIKVIMEESTFPFSPKLGEKEMSIPHGCKENLKEVILWSEKNLEYINTIWIIRG